MLQITMTISTELYTNVWESGCYLELHVFSESARARNEFKKHKNERCFLFTRLNNRLKFTVTENCLTCEVMRSKLSDWANIKPFYGAELLKCDTAWFGTQQLGNSRKTKLTIKDLYEEQNVSGDFTVDLCLTEVNLCSTVDTTDTFLACLSRKKMFEKSKQNENFVESEEGKPTFKLFFFSLGSHLSLLMHSESDEILHCPCTERSSLYIRIVFIGFQ